jgi:hypothetical protein
MPFRAAFQDVTAHARDRADHQVFGGRCGSQSDGRLPDRS